MATFIYKATKKNGEKVNGELEAETREEVVDALHKQDLIVLKVDQKIAPNFKELGSFQIGGVPLKDRVFFAKQLTTMLDAGLPIAQALDILVQQTANPAFKKQMASILDDVQNGTALSVAFAKHKSVFNDVQISLLKAGEESGNMTEVMKQIAVDLEKSNDLSGKIKGAMIYPIIILVAVVVVMFVMVVFMVPAVKDLYADFGGHDLPLVTQILVSFSEFVSNPFGGTSIVFVVVSSVFGYRYYRSTKAGRAFTDEFFLKAPVFGNLITMMQLTQMTRLTSMLLKSGMPIVDTLGTVKDSMDNVHFRDALEMASEDVSKGIPMAVPLSKSKFIPMIVSQMIATGEETGALDKVLESLANYYETEVNQITGNLTKLMEPLILLVVGGLVAVLAVAIYLPIYQVGQFIQ